MIIEYRDNESGATVYVEKTERELPAKAGKKRLVSLEEKARQYGHLNGYDFITIRRDLA